MNMKEWFNNHLWYCTYYSKPILVFKSFGGLEGFTKLVIELVQFHLYPNHIDFSLVLQPSHVVYVTRKRKVLIVDHETQVQKSMEKRVPEKVSNLIDQVPIPFAKLHQNRAVTLRKDVQMSLGQWSSSEESFQKYLVLPLARNHIDNCLRLSLLFQGFIEFIESLLIRTVAEFFFACEWFGVFEGR